jgi:hypothetical protein
MLPLEKEKGKDQPQHIGLFRPPKGEEAPLT